MSLDVHVNPIKCTLCGHSLDPCDRGRTIHTHSFKNTGREWYVTVQVVAIAAIGSSDAVRVCGPCSTRIMDLIKDLGNKLVPAGLTAESRSKCPGE